MRGGKHWIERGSHSVNVYGYEFDPKNNGLLLKIVNPGENYLGSVSGKMYDNVRAEVFQNSSAETIPKLTKLTLAGPGFDRPGRLAVIKNVYIFKPRGF